MKKILLAIVVLLVALPGAASAQAGGAGTTVPDPDDFAYNLDLKTVEVSSDASRRVSFRWETYESFPQDVLAHHRNVRVLIEKVADHYGPEFILYFFGETPRCQLLALGETASSWVFEDHPVTATTNSMTCTFKIERLRHPRFDIPPLPLSFRFLSIRHRRDNEAVLGIDKAPGDGYAVFG
jgi:hypothetical protein